MPQSTLPTQPFQHIALTLSGGGYRAAAFHLGTIDYLNRVCYKGKPLLHQVEILSTVSGGTICGACYAWHLKQGSSFDDFYSSLCAFMGRFDLIEAGLQRIHHETNWASHKQPNLINAFAQIYGEELFQNHTFGLFVDLERESLHLKEVIFNATEFKYGLPFRFQNTGRCGNGRIWLTNKEMSELPLGDIVAASSCFPGGFEPIAFPDDFMSPEASNLRKLVEEGYAYCELKDQVEQLEEDEGTGAPDELKERLASLEPSNRRKAQYCNGPIGLMDGGIVDNQGIQAVILAERRRSNKAASESTPPLAKSELEKQVDLLIISDVSSPYMTQLSLANYQKVQEEGMNLPRWINLARSKVLGKFRWAGGLLVLLGAALLFTGISTLQSLQTVFLVFIFLGGILLLLIGLASVFLPGMAYKGYQQLLRKVRRMLKMPVDPNQNYRWQQLLPGFTQKYIPNILRLEFDQLGPMLTDRVNSVMTMVTEVFMKQVRRLIYERVYEDDSWENRRISNFIYELRKEDHQKNMIQKSWLHEKALREPGENIMTVAEKAASMETTLWFTEQDGKEKMMDHLIACGQFTICFNLLEYIYKLRRSPDYADHPDKEHLDQLYEVMMTDWKAFQQDPFVLMKGK